MKYSVSHIILPILLAASLAANVSAQLQPAGPETKIPNSFIDF